MSDGLQLSLARLNHQWPECEVHPDMKEGDGGRID
jgi:hypothetical protein